MPSAVLISRQLAEEAASRRLIPQAIPDTPPLQTDMLWQLPTDAELHPDRPDTYSRDASSFNDSNPPTPLEVTYNPYRSRYRRSARDRLKAIPKKLRHLLRRLLKPIRALRQRIRRWRLKKEIRKEIDNLPESSRCTMPCFHAAPVQSASSGWAVPVGEEAHPAR